MGAMWERGEGEGRRETSRESSILLNMVVLSTGNENSRKELLNANSLVYVKVRLHQTFHQFINNYSPCSLDSLHCPQLLKMADNSCVRALVSLPVHILKHTVIEDERIFCIQWQHT